MKHILAVALFSTTILATSQCTKYAVVENFTNVGCGPCYSAHLIFDDMMATYPTEVFGIGYHINYPDPEDPMYLHASDQMEYIQEYYDVFGVPHIKVGGVWAGGIDEEIVDAELDETASIGIEVLAEISGDELITSANVLSCSTVPDGNYSIKFIIVETLYINSPPQNWALDFTVWHNIYRRGIPSEQGDEYQPASEGNSVQYEFTTDVHPDWNPDHLKVIVVVQDEDTHDVVNAGMVEVTVTSIAENEANSTFQLHPNPASNMVTVSSHLKQPARVLLKNLTGQVIHEQLIFQGSSNIDVSKMASGLYICDVIDQSGMATSKRLLIQ